MKHYVVGVTRRPLPLDNTIKRVASLGSLIPLITHKVFRLPLLLPLLLTVATAAVVIVVDE